MTRVVWLLGRRRVGSWTLLWWRSCSVLRGGILKVEVFQGGETKVRLRILRGKRIFVVVMVCGSHGRRVDRPDERLRSEEDLVFESESVNSISRCRRILVAQIHTLDCGTSAESDLNKTLEVNGHSDERRYGFQRRRSDGERAESWRLDLAKAEYEFNTSGHSLPKPHVLIIGDPHRISLYITKDALHTRDSKKLDHPLLPPASSSPPPLSLFTHLSPPSQPFTKPPVSHVE
ncbi:hypothetical protein BDZ97DRAFT_1388663 [Flammula alnicola]|nr:hypothetical protein BDZ97DRAFT_1388663 [Flammula alnicola]